jgi:hypothetical protein
MSPDEAYRLLLDVFGDQVWGWELEDLLDGNVLCDEEIAEIERRVMERAPEAMQAPGIVNEENRRRYEHNRAEFRREIARCGSHAVGKAAQEMFADPAVFNAFNDASDEYEAKLARALGVRLAPLRLGPMTRARASRPRRTRSSHSRASPTRLAGDDPEPPLDPLGPVAG